MWRWIRVKKIKERWKVNEETESFVLLFLTVVEAAPSNLDARHTGRYHMMPYMNKGHNNPGQEAITFLPFQSLTRSSVCLSSNRNRYCSIQNSMVFKVDRVCRLNSIDTNKKPDLKGIDPVVWINNKPSLSPDSAVNKDMSLHIRLKERGTER